MEKKCRERSEETKQRSWSTRLTKSYSQIGRENGVHYTTVMKWCLLGSRSVTSSELARHRRAALRIRPKPPHWEQKVLSFFGAYQSHLRPQIEHLYGDKEDSFAARDASPLRREIDLSRGPRESLSRGARESQSRGARE